MSPPLENESPKATVSVRPAGTNHSEKPLIPLGIVGEKNTEIYDETPSYQVIKGPKNAVDSHSLCVVQLLGLSSALHVTAETAEDLMESGVLNISDAALLAFIPDNVRDCRVVQERNCREQVVLNLE